MKQDFLSLKDFGLNLEENIMERANAFQSYINQMKQFETKCKWIMSNSGIGSKMKLENSDKIVSAYISNDYLGMSQRAETIEAGIEALRKYGTGACAAQAIGGYIDIHKKLEHEIADFVGQEDALLFSSGFGANAGLLRGILEKK